MPLSALHLSIYVALAAIIYQYAPGDPAWIQGPNEIPVASSIGSNYTLQNFVGGDGSTVLVGRLYLPTSSDDGEDDATKDKLPPIVVMAHGLGLTQDCKLDPFIQAFRDAGMAVLTFDYATFGWSQGWPRHQVIPNRHVADLKAAIQHVRTSLAGQVDTSRMALWGTSLGGGHVLTVAAAMNDPDIKAVVANVPHVKSGLEMVFGAILRDPPTAFQGLARVSGALLKWMGTKMYGFMTGQPTTSYIPLVGAPGSAAMMQDPGDEEGYGRLVEALPPALKWKNLASVVSVLPVLMYRPYNNVAAIQIPTLLLPAENDTLCPAADSIAAHERMDTSKLVVLEGLSHFDVYQGEPLQTVLKETVPFLQHYLNRE